MEDEASSRTSRLSAWTHHAAASCSSLTQPAPLHFMIRLTFTTRPHLPNPLSLRLSDPSFISVTQLPCSPLLTFLCLLTTTFLPRPTCSWSSPLHLFSWLRFGWHRAVHWFAEGLGSITVLWSSTTIWLLSNQPRTWSKTACTWRRPSARSRDG